MALINLQTDLKSLKYSDFGAEKPFITKNINNPPDESGIEKATTHRIDDLNRFRKFLTSGKGITWVANQGALNVIEAQIKTRSDGNSRSFAGQILSGGRSTAKLIASTAAQIPVNGTGTHFVEGFSGKSGYLKGVQGHVLARNGGFIPTSNILEQTVALEEGKTETINVGSKILGKYLQPGAIKVFNPQTDQYVRNPDFKADQKNFLQTIFGGGNVTPNELKYRTNSKIEVPGLSYGMHSVVLSGSKDTNNINPLFDQTQPESESNPKTISIVRTRAAQGFVNNGDRITVRQPVSGSLAEFATKMTEQAEQFPELYGNTKDLIKFNIKTVAPRSSNEDGPLITRLDFRAYIDSFSDSFNGDWSNTRYIGRAEELYSYSGMSRSIQFSFKVVAHTQRELVPIYNKLNKLVGSTAPNYMNQNYMRGTFNMVTVGDYLINMPGFFTSINLTWNKDYPWAHSEDTGGELPTILDVQCSYQPIHRSAPTNGMVFIGDDFNLANDTNFEVQQLDEVVITG